MKTVLSIVTKLNYLLFTLLIAFSCNKDVAAQNTLRWHIEGSLHHTTGADSDVYSFDKDLINNSNYTERVDPFLWGYVVHQNDTFDFEILVADYLIPNNKPSQISIYTSDQSLDIQTTLPAIYNSSSSNAPLNLEHRAELQFNIFEYKSRTNIAYEPGNGGQPKKLSIGLSAPNHNPTSVGVLHAQEIYYVEKVGSTSAPEYTKLDPCQQVNVSRSDNPSDSIKIAGEPIDHTWFHAQKTSNKYPFNSTARTYMHVMQIQNLCDHDLDNKMDIAEATYQVFFEPMSSFIIGRRDIKKDLNYNPGLKSSIGLIAKKQTLPIELTSFDVAWKNQTTVLSWQTATETNNDYFEVQHSIDGITWNVVEQITGAGNSIELVNYTTIDEENTNTVSYYRLKQVDYDTKYSYSKTVVLERPAHNKTLSLFPNPAQSILNVTGIEKTDLINIYNSLGQNVTALVRKNSITAQSCLLNISALPSGYYHVEIKNSAHQSKQVKLMMKQ